MPTLVVQLGHCYRRTGATGTTGEQEYAAKVGDACKALLHSRGGWSVRLILADDPAGYYAGDAFFAIHCDGSTSADARGASVGYRTPEGQVLAQAWKRAYAARGWPGFRPDNYTDALRQYYGTGTAVNRGNRRAVILECGFRTNQGDRALLDGPGGPERVALSIGDALGIPTTPPQQQETDVDATQNAWLGNINHEVVDKHPSKVNPDWNCTLVEFAQFGDQHHVNNSAKLDTVLAVLNAVLQAVTGGQVDPDAVLARVDTAVREATSDSINNVVLPALRGVLVDVLGEDNEDQADAIVAAMGRALLAHTPAA